MRSWLKWKIERWECYLEADKKDRREWRRGAARGGGRRRGRGDGAAERSEALAVEINDRDRDPERNAIVKRRSEFMSEEAEWRWESEKLRNDKWETKKEEGLCEGLRTSLCLVEWNGVV